MPNASRGEGDKAAREYAYVRELLLDIRQVSFQVGGRLILDRLDLTIQPSEIHALLGANGSGKRRWWNERAAAQWPDDDLADDPSLFSKGHPVTDVPGSV